MPLHAFLTTFDCQLDPFPTANGAVRGFRPSSNCQHWVYRPQGAPAREEGLFVEHAGHYTLRILECGGIEVNTVILDAAQTAIATTPIPSDIAGVFYAAIEEVAP